MKMLKPVFLVAIAVQCALCSLPSHPAGGQRALCRLNVESAPPLYGEAVSATIDELRRTGESPEEFFVQFPEKPSGDPVVVLNLWHKSAFEERNYGHAGNPGGKCRDVHYDTRQRKIIKVLFWQ
jgi:hypothetical protein